MRLTGVTITGADESVTPYDLCELSDAFPWVEWGVLLSATREGKEARYPARGWIDNLLERASGTVSFAGHLCGQWSRDAIGGPFLWAMARPGHFLRFRRLQFNGAECSAATLDRLGDYKKAFPDKGFIVQCGGFPNKAPTGGPQFLLDRSGGRGIELTEFPAPAPGVYCGYSGGLGPDNLGAVLAGLTAMPGDAPFWVDLESKARSDVDGRSVFDLAKVRRCLEIAAPFVRGS